jgi:hypothetical protein
MSRKLTLTAALLVQIAGGACASTSSSQEEPTPSRGPDGIEFELAVSRLDAFRRTLVAFVQSGLPVTEASEAAGTIETGPYQFNAQTVATYRATISGSERLARVGLRGTFTAPSLGITGQPINHAEYGFRARLWRHLARLARTIETQPLTVVIPDEEIIRSTP